MTETLSKALVASICDTPFARIWRIFVDAFGDDRCGYAGVGTVLALPGS